MGFFIKRESHHSHPTGTGNDPEKVSLQPAQNLGTENQQEHQGSRQAGRDHRESIPRQ